MAAACGEGGCAGHLTVEIPRSRNDASDYVGIALAVSVKTALPPSQRLPRLEAQYGDCLVEDHCPYARDTIRLARVGQFLDRPVGSGQQEACAPAPPLH